MKLKCSDEDKETRCDQKVKNHVKLDVLATMGVNNDGIVLVMGSFMNKLAVLSTKTKKPKNRWL